MWQDRVSNPGPLTYKSGALLTALRGPALPVGLSILIIWTSPFLILGVSDECFHLTCILHRNSYKQTVKTLIRRYVP